MFLIIIPAQWLNEHFIEKSAEFGKAFSSLQAGINTVKTWGLQHPIDLFHQSFKSGVRYSKALQTPLVPMQNLSG